MLEFHYLATWNDTWAHIERLMTSLSVKLYMDRDYSDPEPECIDRLDMHTRRLVRYKPRLFIWCKEYSTFPIQMDSYDHGDSRMYYISIKDGGPTIEWTLARSYKEDGMTNLVTGSLVCHGEYYHPKTSIAIGPSEDFKSYYREIVILLKGAMIRHKRRQFIWMGNESFRLVKENKAIILGFD